MFLEPAAIFVDTIFGTSNIWWHHFLAPAIFGGTIVWHQQYLVAPNDFDHFGTCLKASQLLAPEFQPLRLALYTATAIFAPPISVDLSNIK